MAVELTTEQSERLERILRGIGGSMSPEAAREFRGELGTIPNGDGRTADELLGYDEFGLPS